MAKYADSDYTIYAQLKLAEYYWEKKDIENAIDSLETIIETYTSKKPSSAARAYYEMANIYFNEKGRALLIEQRAKYIGRDLIIEVIVEEGSIKAKVLIVCIALFEFLATITVIIFGNVVA